ncbi:MAG: hypothetical protein EPO30_06050 [Lysobacteraceae bacterium]|nr:MAG: hypothetical protein EPO30_06050 [Xanthomonadaceae bacterium]
MRPLLPLCFLALALAGCSGSDDSTAPAASTADAPLAPAGAVHGLEPLPQGRWTELARQLVATEDLASATRITREVLARGGMATTDGEKIVVPAIGPATPYAMTALEARNLAIEARNRETAFRLHASEFAHFLDTFAWDLGGSTSAPAWLTEDEARARRDEALAEVAAAGDAVLASGVAADRALAARIPALEAAAEEALAALGDAKAAINTVPLAQREPLYARLESARQASGEANKALREARRSLADGSRERTRNANRAKDRAHREFVAWNQIGPNYTAGDALLRFLDAWVREAAKHPDDPQSFTPLFLAEMARLQQAPFDLLGSEYVRPARGSDLPVDLRGGPRSDDYRLTLLEMQLFVAAFQRGQPPAPTSAAATPSSQPAWLATHLVDAVLPPAHAQASLSSCADIKSILGGDSPGEASASDWAVNEVANEATKALGGLFDIPDGLLSGLGSASKILRVVIQFANTETRVNAEQGQVHKPAKGGKGHGSRFAWFTASAGVDPKDLEDYERALQDQETRSAEIINQCFGALELPSLQSLKEVADAAENWRVQWEIRPLHPEHLNIPMRDPDNAFVKRNSVQREMNLKRASPAHAEARLKAEVAPEQASSGELAVAHATVVAKVVDTGAPGFSEMVNAIKGIFGMGMSDIVVDLAAGWMKHILVPRAAASQSIEFHCLDKEYIRNVGNPVADGRPLPRTRDHCVVPAEGE